MERKKWIFLSIIFLLIILIPITSLSIYYKYFKEENPKHIFHYQNQLYFYSNNKLVGIYKCQTSNCDYATYTIDDAKYAINYYESNDVKSNLINKRYVFIKDKNILLYDLKNNKKLLDLKAVKNYGIGIENDIFIVKDINNLEGVISLKNNLEVIIPITYEFVGLSNNIVNDKIVASYFISKNNNGWVVLNNSGNELSSYIQKEIYDINNQFIEIKNNNYYELYNFNGKRVEEDSNFINIKFIDKYIEFITDNYILYYFDYNTNNAISAKLNLYKINDSSYYPYSAVIENNKLVIKIYRNNEDFEIYSYQI